MIIRVDFIEFIKYLFKGERVHHCYDGILQPPDKDTNSNWKNRFTNYFKRFFAEDMVRKYFNSTVEAMLYQLSDEISKCDDISSIKWTFHDLTDYLSNVYENLNSFYSLVRFDHVSREVLLILLYCFFFLNFILNILFDFRLFSQSLFK